MLERVELYLYGGIVVMISRSIGIDALCLFVEALRCDYHFLASMPSGGLALTSPFPTSAQFVLKLVPPLSV